MTITTHTRAQRGYYRRYYAANRAELSRRRREEDKCRYRLGWAEWLITELIAYWYAESVGIEPQKLSAILHSPPTSDQWMHYVSAGRSRLSTGRNETPIRSTG